MGKEDESVLVLTRESVFPESSWEGINSLESERIASLASTLGEFRRRGEIEEDPSLKQIIPFIVFNYQNRYLLMRKPVSGKEQRQDNLYSLGIRGHLSEGDLEQEDISIWAKREFRNQVDHQGNLNFEVIGVLNDESNLVEKDYLGVVIMARGDSPQLGIREELKRGKLVTLSEAVGYYDFMENWSKIVFRHLQSLEEQGNY